MDKVQKHNSYRNHLWYPELCNSHFPS